MLKALLIETFYLKYSKFCSLIIIATINTQSNQPVSQPTSKLFNVNVNKIIKNTERNHLWKITIFKSIRPYKWNNALHLNKQIYNVKIELVDISSILRFHAATAPAEEVASPPPLPLAYSLCCCCCL